MNKTEGNVETCQSCGTEVKCVMTKSSGNYAGKLQWQNGDGTAHYFFDHTKKQGEEGQFSCVVPKKEEKPQQEKITAPPETNTEGDPTDGIIDKQNLLLDKINDKVIEHLVLKYDTSPENLNGNEVGMRTKEIYRHIRG